MKGTVTDAYDYTDMLKKVLDKQEGLVNISKEFKNFTDNAEKVKFLEKLLIDNKLMPADHLTKEKDEEKAINLRHQGNDQYKNKHFLRALELYNQSLCFSPNGSENIGIVYANRSAVFFELQLYDKSLENVTKAIKHDYKTPEKLEEREKKCKDKIKNNHYLLLLHEPVGHTYLQLSYPRNPKIPFIVNSLELKASPKFGRYVVTNENLKPGDIIAIEEPFSKCLLKTEIYKYCCNCLSDNCMNLFPCANCTQVMFCSDKCHREGMEKFHRFECCIGYKLNKICTKIMRIAAHTFFEALSIFKYNMLDLMNFLLETVDSPTTVFDYDLSAERMIKRRMLTAIDSLATNEVDRSSNDLFQRSGIVAILTHLFLNYTPLADVLTTAEYRNFFRRFIFKQTQIAAINYHGIFDGIMTKSQSMSCPQYASGSFPFCSLINHSCAPNIVRVSFRCKNYIMVNRPIGIGEQLFDNYGYHHCLESVNVRRCSLLSQYMFKCGCVACVNDFPLYQDLPHVDNDFEHFLGDDVAALAEMNVETAKNRFKDYCAYLNKMDPFYPCHEISCLQECILRCSFIFKSTQFKLKMLQTE